MIKSHMHNKSLKKSKISEKDIVFFDGQKHLSLQRLIVDI